MLALVEVLLVVAVPLWLVITILGQRRAPGPGQVLVVYGRRGPGGRGHALVRGSTLVVPLVERAEILEVGALSLVSRAASDRVLRATLTFPEDAERLLRTLELLGDKPRAELAELAEDVLCGVLAHQAARGVSADQLGASVAHAAREPLAALGLELSSLDVQSGSR